MQTGSGESSSSSRGFSGRQAVVVAAVAAEGCQGGRQ